MKENNNDKKEIIIYVGGKAVQTTTIPQNRIDIFIEDVKGIMNDIKQKIIKMLS